MLQGLVAEGTSLGVRMETLQTASNLHALALTWQEDAVLACNEEAEPVAIEQVGWPSMCADNGRGAFRQVHLLLCHSAKLDPLCAQPCYVTMSSGDWPPC